MQFLDKTKIFIKAGDGGDGCASFHREKFVMNGGPSGGDGGKGGDVVFVADPQLNTLIDFRYKRHYRAGNGENGRAELQTGKDGERLVVHVPVGTLVRDPETESVIADLHEVGVEKVVLYGGKGGKGNARFSTPTNQSPRFAQPGRKTREFEVVLELLTIADVGIIGMPSVGKSTILSVLTRAKPKIAAYHFTTLTPNLGVAVHRGKSFVLADIPGLIEGAAEGTGLGHDFLRHVERTRILIHVIDGAGSEGRDPVDDFDKINEELFKYSPKLAALPQLAAVNKQDLPDAAQMLPIITGELKERGYRAFGVSAATVQGFDELLDAVTSLLSELPERQLFDEVQLEQEPTDDRFTISRDSDGVYVVSGGQVERLLDSTDPNDEESMRRFQQMLIKTGIISALREMGCKDGDSIRLGEWEFDFVD